MDEGLLREMGKEGMRMKNAKEIFWRRRKRNNSKAEREKFLEGGDQQGDRRSKGIKPESHD